MNDTPPNVKALQLKIWLSKSPEERLMRMMQDNAAMMQFWATARKKDNVDKLSPKSLNSSQSKDLGISSNEG
jgi:hypothetical protein